MLPLDDDSVEIIARNNNEGEEKSPDPRDRRVDDRPFYQSNEEQNVREVKVLLSKNKVAQKLITMDVPLLCNEIDIITAIFSECQILKDGTGYKVLDDSTERRVEVCEVNEPRSYYQYRIDAESPTARKDQVLSSDDCQIIEKDDENLPQEIAPRDCFTPKSIDSQETYFDPAERMALDQQEDEQFWSCLDAKNDIKVKESDSISSLDAKNEIDGSQNDKNNEALFGILSRNQPIEGKHTNQDDHEEMVDENAKGSNEIKASKFYSQGYQEVQSSSSQSRKTVQLSDSPVFSRRKSQKESSKSPRDSILAVYPAPPARGGITIYKENYKCLGEAEYLNDVIIDFYLKYLMIEVLSEEDRNRTHVFSSQFYTRLSKKPVHADSDEEVNMSESERRHVGVQRWTKNVNIFEKDFIIIPINEYHHWNLAIICFPGLVGTIDEDSEGIYRPCIMFFDSLSNKNKDRIAMILRGYLSQEYLAKMGETKKFTNSVLQVRYPRLPKQSNATDCGLYVLQYVESFFKYPIQDFTAPLDLSQWFKISVIKGKREEIASLVTELAKNYNPDKNVVMPVLRFPSNSVSSDEEDLDSRFAKRTNPFHKDTFPCFATARLSKIAENCAAVLSKKRKNESSFEERDDCVRDASSSSDQHNVSLDSVTFKNLTDENGSMDVEEDNVLMNNDTTSDENLNNKQNLNELDCQSSSESSFVLNSSTHKYNNRHKISIIKENFSGTKSHIFQKSSIFSNGSREPSGSGVRPKRECQKKTKSDSMLELKNKFQERKRKNEMKEEQHSTVSKKTNFKWVDTSAFRPSESTDKFSFYSVDDEPGIPTSTTYRNFKMQEKQYKKLQQY